MMSLELLVNDLLAERFAQKTIREAIEFLKDQSDEQIIQELRKWKGLSEFQAHEALREFRAEEVRQ